MKKLIFALFLFTGIVFAQTPTNTLTWSGPNGIQGGQTITLPVIATLTNGATAESLQFTIGAMPSDVVSYTVNTALTNKSVFCNLTTRICLIVGMNSSSTSLYPLTAIPSGSTVATINVTMKATLSGTPQTFTWTDAQTSTATANPVATVFPSALTLNSFSKCDLNRDGATNYSDALLIVQVSNGTVPPPAGVNFDLSLNGPVGLDVTDVQVVINAAANGVCNAK